jgi:hypothetical protein
MTGPPTIAQLLDLMNTTSIFIVSDLTTITGSGDSVVPCVAFADGTQPPTGSPNRGLAMLRQLSLMRGGASALDGLYAPEQSSPGPTAYLATSIYGNAVIATGDADFLTACQALFPPRSAPPVTTTPSTTRLEFNEIGVIKGQAQATSVPSVKPAPASHPAMVPEMQPRLEFNEIGVIIRK